MTCVLRGANAIALCALVATVGCGGSQRPSAVRETDLSGLDSETLNLGPKAEEPVVSDKVRTGTLARSDLVAALRVGPAHILSEIRIAPARRSRTTAQAVASDETAATMNRQNSRFIGWTVLEVVGPRLATLDLDIGDVVLSVNGHLLERPDDVGVLWKELETATEISVSVLRGEEKFTILFHIGETP